MTTRKVDSRNDVTRENCFRTRQYLHKICMYNFIRIHLHYIPFVLSSKCSIRPTFAKANKVLKIVARKKEHKEMNYFCDVMKTV